MLVKSITVIIKFEHNIIYVIYAAAMLKKKIFCMQLNCIAAEQLLCIIMFNTANKYFCLSVVTEEMTVLIHFSDITHKMILLYTQ